MGNNKSTPPVVHHLSLELCLPQIGHTTLVMSEILQSDPEH